MEKLNLGMDMRVHMMYTFLIDFSLLFILYYFSLPVRNLGVIPIQPQRTIQREKMIQIQILLLKNLISIV